MNERRRFVTDWERGLYSMVELCERYGVSRKTGYEWVDRYEREGPPGLQERSRAPHRCPHRISAAVAAAICAARRQHPGWGPEKILQWLRPRQPGLALPATSTAGDLLARRGLVRKRRRRRHYSRNSTCGGSAWAFSISASCPRVLSKTAPTNRMHRTLKAATARPPKAHLLAQQRAFNRRRAAEPSRGGGEGA